MLLDKVDTIVSTLPHGDDKARVVVPRHLHELGSLCIEEQQPLELV